MCILFIVFPLVLLACILDREPLTLDDAVGLGTCRECSYSLVGRPDAAQCPECGAVNPGARPGKVLEWRYAVKPRRPAFLLFCITLMVVSTLALEPLAREILAASYVADGYTWAVGRNAATVRVLRVSDTAFWALAPICSTVALLPVCCFARSARRTWSIAAIVLACGLVLSALWLASMKS